ncbi:Zinc finger mynd domain-containing protein 17 [Mycena venus]|uniref:Zinc finger mynd domain-containing protein 17 n=1 Tax=Mycena venus TaxID=2733690 RepID=A0A8H7DDL6_9AGAR|nr:Zinc finger mynd domain-containing protein 17 [Mycena venus]
MELGPLPAMMGLACHKCLNEMDVQLSRCSGCHRISYCGKECQNSDWKAHKLMCKALSSLEKNSLAAAMLVSLLPKRPITDLGELRKLTDQQIAICLTSLQRPPTAVEHSWLDHEPRCIVCTRTDMVIRVEAAINGTTADDTKRLIPCPQCMLSFCCSPAHWEAARELHHGPSDELRDGLSQCQMNKLTRGQIMFETTMASWLDRLRQLVWIPQRVKSGWVSLDGVSWEGEFSGEIRQSFGMPAPLPITFLMTAASDTLSMAMTILYGLGKLNDDDGWTRKQRLTVHILGASTKEVSCRRVFEEILHRTPEVKTLKLIMCGPEVPRRDSLEQKICPDCMALGRSYVLEYAADPYHEFVEKQGNKFENPDFCVGFNSGGGPERKLPSLFTAYNREEAEGDAAVLRDAGAALHPALGPALNPWGSMKGVATVHSVYGFHVENGWLAESIQTSVDMFVLQSHMRPKLGSVKNIESKVVRYQDESYARDTHLLLDADGDIDRVYLIAPANFDVFPPMKVFIDFAIQKGVKRLVLMSATMLQEGGPTMGKVHEYLHSCEVKYYALRPSWFFGSLVLTFLFLPRSTPVARLPDNLLRHYSDTIRGHDETVNAAGSGLIGWISTDDIADVAFKAFTDKVIEHTNPVTVGPELLSCAQVGNIL